MINFDGEDYKKIALHGGGNPMFGHYVGLLESLKWFEDFESEYLNNIPFVTSSAGSMAILFFVYKIKSKDAYEDVFKVVSQLFSKLIDECENVLSNLDQKSIISFDFLDNLVSTEFGCIYDMTFKDLNDLIPNFDWTICCSKHDNFEFTLQTYGTHTPEIVIWKACFASMSLPIIFPPIEINGCFNCDGDFSNWVEAMAISNDSSILHIGPKRNVSSPGGLPLNTEITLMDEFIKLATVSFLRLMKNNEPAHGVNRIEFMSCINKHFFSDEYIESGRLMAKKFVLK